MLVDIRLALVVPGPDPRPRRRGRAAGSKRAPAPVRFDGEWVETPVLRGEPAGRHCAPTGPVVFELPEATLVLPPGWQAEVDDAGTIVARFEAHA